jgi:hypothetical protein
MQGQIAVQCSTRHKCCDSRRRASHLELFIFACTAQLDKMLLLGRKN